jgi:phosphopantothenoylcysteine decarboxylase/phosphopantothenate--cysteine ligase
VLLGVTGGIASYKTTWLARLLQKAGAEVDVVLSRSAREFVGSVTFESLTGRPVHSELFAAGQALDHIRLAREAAMIVVAPATADFLARSANGNADDLLSAILLAARCPVLLVPAMNDVMWQHRQTQTNVGRCRDIGYTVLEPDTGDLAIGEGAGPGRMPEPESILAHVGRVLEEPSLRGRHVVVTAGPTREAIDPVRFLSNRSSGKMGVAIATSAWRRGAAVTLIHGPLEIPVPTGPEAVPVESTAQMRDAVARALPAADALIMAAAPADFGAAEPAAKKLKKAATSATLALTPTADILSETQSVRRDGCVIIGFALETDNVMEHARAKLAAKHLDAIVVNDATEAGAAFGSDTNHVTVLFADGRIDSLPMMAKADVADALIDRLQEMLRGR